MPRVSRACPSLWSNSSALSMSAAVIQDHGEGQGGGGGGLFQCSYSAQVGHSAELPCVWRGFTSGICCSEEWLM